MRQRILCAAAAAVFVLSAVLGAAETNESLPEGINLHISASSLTGLIESLDEAAAAVTAGTSKEVPPGFLGMIIQMQMPLQPDAWESDEPLHVLLTREQPKKPVFLITSDSLESFVSGLTDSGVDAEKIEAEEYAGAAYRAFLRGLGPLEIVDAGNGLVAAAQNWEDAAFAVQIMHEAGWIPSHPEDADVQIEVNPSVIFPMENILMVSIGLQTAIANAAAEHADKLAEWGISEAAVLGTGDLIRAAFARMSKELALTSSIIYKLSLDGDGIHLSVQADAAPDSFFSKQGRKLENLEDVSNPLAAKVPAGAASLAVYAPTEDQVSYTPDEIAGFVAGIAAGAAPDMEERIRAMTAASIAAFDQGSVIMGYPHNGEPYYAFFAAVRDPQAALDSIIESGAAGNEFLGRVFTNPDYSFRIDTEEGSLDGNRYVTITPVVSPVVIEAFTEFLQNAYGTAAPQTPELGRSLAAVHNGTFIMVSGREADEEHLKNLTAMLDSPGEPLIETENAETVFGMLRNSQAAIGIADMDTIRDLVIAQMLQNPAASQGYGPYAVRALENTNFENIDSMAGYAVGADEGRLSFEIAVPAAAVSGLIRNYEEFERAVQRELRRSPEQE